MLQQLQAECGDTGDYVDNVSSESVEASVERVRSFVDSTRARVTPATSTESEPTSPCVDQKIEEPKQESQKKDVTELVVESELTRDLIISSEEESSKNFSGNNVVGVSSQLRAPLPDLITPQRQVSVRNQLPDIVCDALRATNKTKKKSPRRRSFRLTTLRTPSKPQTPAAALTWTNVGQKLAEISDSLDTPGTRRRSLPPPASHLRSNRPETSPRRSSCNPRRLCFGTNDDMPGGDGPGGVNTEHIVNNVLKVVQVFGLFLVMKKFENMLK